MKIAESFYKQNSDGNYRLIAKDNGDLSHFGWEVPLSVSDASEHDYTVHWRKDFTSDQEFMDFFWSFCD